jgi:hypothetical protein
MPYGQASPPNTSKENRQFIITKKRGLVKKRPKKGTIMLPKSAVTIANDSTEATDVPKSSKEPASQTNESGQQRDDDRQNWDWIHHCDEVISNLPIGLT